MRPLKELKKIHMKALIITAHPDDESLFMGGTIAEFKKWRWAVLCVTDCDARYNGKRRRELLKVCRIYNEGGSNVKPFMLGLPKRKSQIFKKMMKAKIWDFIDEFGPFDIVFTHNSKGEYGHKTHKLLHDAVEALKLRNLYNFSLYPLKDTSVVTLAPKSRRAKKKAIDVYLKGSQKTNLSKLKKIVAQAINSRSESFIRVN